MFEQIPAYSPHTISEAQQVLHRTPRPHRNDGFPCHFPRLGVSSLQQSARMEDVQAEHRHEDHDAVKDNCAGWSIYVLGFCEELATH